MDGSKQNDRSGHLYNLIKANHYPIKSITYEHVFLLKLHGHNHIRPLILKARKHSDQQSTGAGGQAK